LDGRHDGPESGIVGGQPNLNFFNDQAAKSKRSGLPHESVVDIHQLRVIVIFQDKLSWPHARLLPEQGSRTEMPL